MSNALIAFFLGAGATAWTYDKFHKRTGGNNGTSAPAAVVVGVIVFLISFTVVSSL